MIEDELKELSVKELLSLADKALSQLVAASIYPVNISMVDQRHADLKMIYKAIADKQTEK